MASSGHDAKILAEMEKQTYHLSQISWFLNSILTEYKNANRAKAEERDKGDRKSQAAKKSAGRKIVRDAFGGIVDDDSDVDDL